MLERDYIMRLIREFMAALERMLEKKEVTTRREELKKLYEQYIGPYAFYFTASIDKVIESLSQESEERRFYKLEMLAELYNAEADMVSKPEADILLRKAFALYDYQENHSKTYSLDRIRKMNDIEKKLQNFENNQE